MDPGVSPFDGLGFFLLLLLIVGAATVLIAYVMSIMTRR